MIRFAEIGLVGVLVIMLLIHLGILLKWIPYTIVWGGRLKTDQEMYLFEGVSVLMTGGFLWLALEESGIVSGFMSENIRSYIMWGMAVMFLMSLLGSITSKNKTEKWLFSPLAFLAMCCAGILAYF